MTDQNRDLPASSDECTGALFGLILIFGSFFLYNPISKWLHHETRPAPAPVVTSAPAHNVANLPQLRAGEVIDFTDGKNRTALIAGWSVSELQGVWSLGTEVSLGFVLAADRAPERLNIKAAVFLESEKLPKQRIEVWSGNTKLSTTILTVAEAEFVVPLDKASPDKDGALILAFHLPDSATPRQILGTSDDRRIAIHLKSVGGLP